MAVNVPRPPPRARIYNRPFLRCLHGCALCLWRLGRLEEARRVFERILSLNPNDNQGARFCREDVRQGRSWKELHEREERQRNRRRGGLGTGRARRGRSRTDRQTMPGMSRPGD